MTLTVIPEELTAAAADITRIGTSLSEAHALAAPATTSIAPAAADEVSTAIAAVFGDVGQSWQAAAAQAVVMTAAVITLAVMAVVCAALSVAWLREDQAFVAAIHAVMAVVPIAGMAVLLYLT
jgi:hypothetical protein